MAVRRGLPVLPWALGLAAVAAVAVTGGLITGGSDTGGVVTGGGGTGGGAARPTKVPVRPTVGPAGVRVGTRR
jgi:hypothetical protein